MRIDILTLFPDMFTGVLNESILKRAKDRGLADYRLINFRDYAENKHLSVDDYPYGGGAGMVLKPEPIYRAIDEIKGSSPANPKIILLCPQGETYSQKKAEELSKNEHLVFICGHYEGYDERIRYLADEEISIGDYVLTGGELGAMVIIDSVVRLLPGVLGNEESPVHDSFSAGLLEHPHYTRPREFKGMKVPEVLISGDHEKIAKWRRKQSLKRTFERRPDLLKDFPLTDEDREWLKDLYKKNEPGY